MDHRLIQISPSFCSCGMLELHSFQESNDHALFQIASDVYHPSNSAPAAILMWLC